MEQTSAENQPPPSGSAEFDPVAFKAELLAEVARQTNGVAARLEKQIAKLAKAETSTPEKTDDDAPLSTAKDDARSRYERKLADITAKLEAEVKARQEAERRAEEKERLSEIRAAVSALSLNPESVDDAFRFFRDTVRRNEAGELVGGDDEKPLVEYVKEVVAKRKTWLPPKDAGGSGIAPGSSPGRHTVVDIDSIRPGMQPDAKKAVVEALRSAITR